MPTASTQGLTFYRLQLKIDVAGEQQLSRVLHRLIRNVKNMEDFWRDDAVPTIQDAIRHQFESEGDPKWPPLSQKYARRKARIAPGAPILVLTGNLKQSLLDSTHPDNILVIRPLRLEYGTRARTRDGRYSLGLIHQKGAPRANIPPRPMIRLLKRFKSDLIRKLRYHLAEPEVFE